MFWRPGGPARYGTRLNSILAEIHNLLANIWLFIIGLMLFLYVVLDGFDLGVGILSLFARNDKHRTTFVVLPLSLVIMPRIKPSGIWRLAASSLVASDFILADLALLRTTIRATSGDGLWYFQL